MSLPFPNSVACLFKGLFCPQSAFFFFFLIYKWVRGCYSSWASVSIRKMPSPFVFKLFLTKSPALELPLPTLPNLGTVGCVWGSNWGSFICEELLKFLNLYIPEKTLPPNAPLFHLKTLATSFSLLQKPSLPTPVKSDFFLFSIPRVFNFHIVHLSHTIYFLIPLALTLAFQRSFHSTTLLSLFAFLNFACK